MANTFFHRGRADLAPQARSAFCAFQHRALYFGWSRFTVHGHATPSGDAAADEALSRTRAEAVARELVRIGFPASTLTLRPHGASRPDPLLPVGDPNQNRVDVVAPAGLRPGMRDAYSYLYE
jgi:outer membrane protein OmpA-like peptidoglycan-associated protein